MTNHSFKFAVKADIRYLGLFYEAKKGLIHSQITRAYVSVLILDYNFLKPNFAPFKAICVCNCGNVRVLRNLRKIETMTHSLFVC